MDSSLWPLATQVAERAKRSGALQSFETVSEFYQEGSLSFQIRQISSLKNKTITNLRDKPSNPFLPYEKDLYVTDAGPEHNILLNKFNVFDHHLLITSKAFIPQTAELSLADFKALFHCLKLENALAFFNNGPLAGASQTHKHLQLIKLETEKEMLPFAMQFEALKDDVPRMLSTLPFKHAALGLDTHLFDPEWFTPNDAANQLFKLYQRLRMTVGIEAINGIIQQPYNLLLTRNWMLLVPRRKESYQDVSLNALAFTGSILVADKKQARQIKSAGLARALTEVSGLI